MVVRNPSPVSAYDDGTNIDFTYNGTVYLSVNKTNGNLLIGGDLKSRESL